MADSQGNTPPEGVQGDVNAPKYVTEEQLNKAITARFTEFSKKQEKSQESFSNTLTGKLEELLKASLPAQKPADAADPPKPSAADSPEFKGLQKRMDELAKENAKIIQERDAERARLKDRDLRSALSEALVKQGGVDPARVKHAVGMLIDSEKRVSYDEDGETIVFRDDADGAVTLADGIRSWVKTDDGKFYLPPRGVNGSGDRGAGRAPATKQQTGVTAESLGEALLNSNLFGIQS